MLVYTYLRMGFVAAIMGVPGIAFDRAATYVEAHGLSYD